MHLLIAIADDFSDSNASSHLPSVEEAASVLGELLNFFLFLFPDFVILKLLDEHTDVDVMSAGKLRPKTS